MIITDIAFKIANFIMFQKISNILSIASFVLIVSTLTSAFFGYKYVTGEKFQKQIMDKVLGGVGDMMPKVLDDSLPKMTGPSIPKQLPKL